MCLTLILFSTIFQKYPFWWSTTSHHCTTMLRSRTCWCDEMLFRSNNCSLVWICRFYQIRCWSFVGDDRVGQNVSIGARCDTKAIVQHELLHALGFYHEQSRSDRDDYVKIWWDEIEEGGSQQLYSLCCLVLWPGFLKYAIFVHQKPTSSFL